MEYSVNHSGTALIGSVDRSLPSTQLAERRDSINGRLEKVGIDSGDYHRAATPVKQLIRDWVDPDATSVDPDPTSLPAGYQDALKMLVKEPPPVKDDGADDFTKIIKIKLPRLAGKTMKDKDGRTIWQSALRQIDREFDPVKNQSEPQHAVGLVEYFLSLEMDSRSIEFKLDGIRKSSKDFDPVLSHPYGWYTLESANLIEALCILRLATYTDDSSILRQRFARYMVQNFIERQIPGLDTPLFVQEPLFNSYTVNTTRDREILSLSMPYITGDSYGTLKQRQKKLEDWPKWSYCHAGTEQAGTNLHVQLTLDEYCKPCLGRRLKERNEDQVLTKYESWKIRREIEGSTCIEGKGSTERRDDDAKKKVPDNAKLITIRHAWLWMFHNRVITVLSDHQSRYPDIPPSWHDCVGIEDSISPVELRIRIGIFLSDLIDLPNNPKTAGFAENFFDAFENSIVILSDTVSQYLKLPSISGKQSTAYFHMNDFDVSKEAGFFHDIGDIREELSMIKSVVLQQEVVWKAAIRTCFPKLWKDGRLTRHISTSSSSPNGESKKSDGESKKSDGESKTFEDIWFNKGQYEDTWAIISRPQRQFEQYKRRIAQLDDDAVRVEASIATLLDLRAKHASMKEAHSTAVMSAAVFGFTFVTIIFTPLSFMASLFALPIKSFQSHQIESRWPNTGAYQTNYIGKYIVTTEFVTLFVTAVAFFAVVEFGFRKKFVEKYKAWRERGASQKATSVRGNDFSNKQRAISDDIENQRTTES